MLKDIKHVKGRKIIFNLPLNGQRTHTNAQTVKRLLDKTKYRKFNLRVRKNVRRNLLKL